MSSLASKGADEEARREAARLMGSVRTEKKAASSRANGFKPGHEPYRAGGRKLQHLYALPCSCGAGDTIEGHKWDCARMKAIKRRVKEGRDILTGELLSPGEA